jgi:hypothetical protein
MTHVSYPTTLASASPNWVKPLLFCLFGGPAAWFFELCGGFALATQPCVLNVAQGTDPKIGLQWTGTAMAILIGIAVLIALSSFVMAWQALKRAQIEAPGNEQGSMDAGAGRARFLALWGMLLGSVFALATAMTAVGFLILPRCTG